MRCQRVIDKVRLVFQKESARVNHKHIVRALYKGFLHREPEPGALEHWEAQVDGGLSLDRLAEIFLGTEEFSRIEKKLSSLFVEPGHFYSPIVNVQEIQERIKTIDNPDQLPAIRISRDEHISLWRNLLPYLREIPFPDNAAEGFRYYFNNPAFSYGDGSILYAMLRHFKPKQLVEIGSGYSSACAFDTIERYLGGNVEVSFVEPYPELLLRLLGDKTAKCVDIHTCEVQKVELELFTSLNAGDVLFIDSTHVVKTGSDVCHEMFEVLPALKPGVLIHFHDIFWPFEYGAEWVLKENRSWNEIYGLRAFLMYNEAFEVVFFNDYFARKCREIIQSDYPAMLKNSGGSIWLRKKC